MHKWLGIAGVGLVVAAQPAAAATPKGPPFAFGGTGAHGAYTVVVKADGSVQASGNGGLTRVGTPHLTSVQLVSLNRSAVSAHFGSLPATTRCPGANAGIASTTWVRVGSKEVTVSGTCQPGFHHLFNALVAVTHFFGSS